MHNNDFPFSVPIQIKMSDLDPFNHVNNGVQCNFFDYGRSCYFEAAFGEAIDWGTLDLVLAHVEIDFLLPIEIHDSIICESKVSAIGNKSFKMVQQLKDKSNEVVKSVCTCVVVGFDRQTHKSIPINENYKEKMRKFDRI